ncbi:MAG TPA: DUF1731 domain-containing protein [Chitinophagaceae bacterium]|nr:DUF1731 domain-containing protein [Chitinophagaceae bacterium]
MNNKKIILAGGTGYIGQALAEYFGKENYIIILGRNVTDHENNAYSDSLLQSGNDHRIEYVQWDAKSVAASWQQHIERADIIINLVGKSVNCRYNAKNKQAIISSRVQATHALGEAVARCTVPPKLWINFSSATIYRNAPDRPQDEFTGEISEWKKDNMPYNALDQLRSCVKKSIATLLHGKSSDARKQLDLDFSVQVCKLWEAAFFSHRTPFTRKIALRAAITLGRGGILTPYLNLCKAGLGGRHGNGKQRFSWVHVEDVCRMVAWLWENKEAEGIYNCAAPNAVTNVTFMHTLRMLTGRRFGLPAPAWLLEPGAWLIRTETELMLKSRWVVSTRAMQEGFRFKYETIQTALHAILADKHPQKTLA